MSPLWLLLLLAPVLAIFVYSLIDRTIKERKSARADAGEVDWDEVRHDYRRNEEAIARGREMRVDQEADLQRKAEEAALEAHRANVEACIERATRLLPGMLPNPLAKSKIQADCAEAEARTMPK